MFEKSCLVRISAHFISEYLMLRICLLLRCPLLGETKPGDPTIPAHLARNGDIRTDLPAYNVYQDGTLTRTQLRIRDGEEWQEDSVAFFIGCSYSFEAALTREGLTPRHVELDRRVPMYKTKYPLCPAGGKFPLIIKRLSMVLIASVYSF